MDITQNLLAVDRRGTCPEDLGFGAVFADHMFIQSFEAGRGWFDAQIKPVENFSMHPATSVLHYAQEIFEGMKAYRRADGGVNLFRPDENAVRFNRSASRMEMPEVDAEFHVKAIADLVRVDQNWVPSAPGSALYIRPTMIATDVRLGVVPSQTYAHYVITGPVGPYFAKGFAPVSVFVSDEARRAVKGGVGEAKTGGNYAASLKVSSQVAKEGFSQVLWLDAVEGRFIEEVGAMNICFVRKDGSIITPELSGSILSGITRKSVLELAPSVGHEATEGRLDINEILARIDSGEITEVFGCGTAAVISPIGNLRFKGKDWVVNNNETGPVTQKLYDALTGIQTGAQDDPFGWVVQVN